jgi:6-phosphofructokinase 1
MKSVDVANIIQRGGTILGTARCLEFKELEVQKHAAEICRKHGIDGIVVIGGDGSYRGAQALARQGINTIGIPGTIDLDITCTEYTIGFDTAVNTAMDAIDKVKDTSSSHERCSIIEVMGRHAGYIALWCGIANGAEDILIPEKYDYNEQKIVDHIIMNRRTGKKHHLIINAEGIGHSTSMAKRIEAATGIETRATILGYMQRGGAPTCKDRYYASIMGAYATDILLQGKTNRVVCYRDGKFVDLDIEEALAMTKEFPEYEYKISLNL